MSGPRIVGIIPARFGSSRLPGKMLAPLAGKTVLHWTHEAAQAAKSLDLLLVATDDERIRAHVETFGGDARMTRSDHKTGSDRLAELAQSAAELADAEIIVNIQGDEPTLDPSLIDAVVRCLRDDEQAVMATVAHPLASRADWLNSAVVKCTVAANGRAMTFSRAPLGHGHGTHADVPEGVYHHVGLYAYRRDFLLQYGSLEMTPLQRAEDLEQLKVLEHGYTIQVAVQEGSALGVDTPEDLQRAEKVLCKQSSSSLPAASARP